MTQEHEKMTQNKALLDVIEDALKEAQNNYAIVTKMYGISHECFDWEKIEKALSAVKEIRESQLKIYEDLQKLKNIFGLINHTTGGGDE